jgi:pyrimidine operon attenuation protein/uracil phosphoribosyltransferase
VGKNLPTSLVERVTVHLTEYDGTDAVLIADKTTPTSEDPRATPHGSSDARDGVRG